VLEYSVFALAALFIAAIFVMFRFGHRLAQLANFFFVGRSQRLALIIDHAGQALRQYAQQWPSVLLCLALSFVMVSLIVVGIVITAATMQLGGLSPLEYGIAGIYAMIANSLPFTPGGLGIGEGAFASACVLLEPATAGIAYGTVFLAFRCVAVISNMPGLIIYLMYPHRAKLLAPAQPRR
jgi:glycosyltransferase 2 family protein